MLYVAPPYDDAGLKVFDVQVDLEQDIDGGVIHQKRKHTFPASILPGIISFDHETLQPVVDWDAIAPLFLQFGLELPVIPEPATTEAKP